MRRGRLWLLGAIALFALAAFLMARGDPKPPPPKAWKSVELPRHMTRDERSRMVRRRVLEAVAAAAVDGGQAPREERRRDPLLSALPPEVKELAVVVEANAIRYSPVGQLLLDCVTSRDDGAGLQRFREATGFDPVEQLDRVMVADQTLVLSGHFGDAKWEQLMKDSQPRAYGSGGTVYERRAGGSGEETIGVWNDQLIVIGPTAREVEQTLDRIEGRGLAERPVLTEEQTYGEIYGVLQAQALAQVMGTAEPELAEKLRTAAEKIELHVDTTRDVGIVARVDGTNTANAEDLGKTLGTALTLGRLKAQAEGADELAELMELARVVPGSGNFNVEMALPLELLQRHLTKCVEDNRARRQGAADAGSR